MKRIGVFAFSGDPIHNGHLYLIDNGRKLFDEFWVVVGSHTTKNHVWSKEERLTMAKDSCPWEGIKFGMLGDDNNIVEFTKRIDRQPSDTIAVFRGIRNPNDTTYEANIVYQIHKITNELPTLFMIPPPELANLSSTKIREYAQKPCFDLLEDLVPPPVLEALHVKYFDLETVQERNVCMQSTNSHKLVDMGFVKFPPTIMAIQVRGMLDPFPYDVVVSQKFVLKRIRIDSVKPLGKRYVPMSQSLGPIIVDANTVMGDETILGYLGPVIIIEGKHRWLDAKEAGEDTILAYVGEKAWELHEKLLGAE